MLINVGNRIITSQGNLKFSLLQDPSEVVNKKAKLNSVTFSDTSPKPFLYSPQDTSSLPPASIKHKHRSKELHPKEIAKAEKSKETASADIGAASNCKTKNSAELKHAADMVVKYLTPAFKEGRIASKVRHFMWSVELQSVSKETHI